MKNYFSSFFYLLAPRFCLVCDTLLLQEDSGICPECKQRFFLPLTDYKVDTEAPEAVKGDLDGSFSLYSYRDPLVKGLLRRFKEECDSTVLPLFVGHMVELLGREKEAFDCVVPVPLSRKGAAKRGHDHTLLLAGAVAKEMNCVVATPLRFKRAKGEQKKFNREMRFKNVADNLICLNRREVENKRILLVDDVMTTGATLVQSASLLKKMGASAVFSLTIARVAVHNNIEFKDS